MGVIYIRWRYLAILFMTIVMSGCAWNKTNNGEARGNSNIQGEAGMNYINMTEKEKELLSSILVNSEKISEGYLLKYQEDTLMQLRACEEYLEEKYAEQELEILDFLPISRMNLEGKVTFSPNGQDEIYIVRFTKSDDGFDCRDDYYGALIREEYDELLEEKLGVLELAIRSYTIFPEPMGKELDGKVQVKKLFHEFAMLNRLTDFYISSTKETYEIKDELQDFIMKNGIRGSYTIYFAPDNLSRNFNELKKEQGAWQRETFSYYGEE